jgi:hypothetical protein
MFCYLVTGESNILQYACIQQYYLADSTLQLSQVVENHKLFFADNRYTYTKVVLYKEKKVPYAFLNFEKY